MEVDVVFYRSGSGGNHNVRPHIDRVLTDEVV